MLVPSLASSKSTAICESTVRYFHGAQNRKAGLAGVGMRRSKPLGKKTTLDHSPGQLTQPAEAPKLGRKRKVAHDYSHRCALHL